MILNMKRGEGRSEERLGVEGGKEGDKRSLRVGECAASVGIPPPQSLHDPHTAGLKGASDSAQTLGDSLGRPSLIPGPAQE